MSTASAAEEIEELRAKAIASMSSSTNPNPVSKPKSPESREEGELSPADDAAVGLPSFPTGFSNLKTPEECLPTSAAHNLVQQAKSDYPSIVKSLPSSSSSRGNRQLRSSITRRYSKNFKRMQVPFNSSNIQSLSWHGKDSRDNLVIRFSDDDSGSDSEESKLEKTVSRKDNIVRANKSEVPVVSASVSSRGLQGGPNTTKLVPEKGLVNAAPVSSVRRAQLTSYGQLANSTEKDSSIPQHNPRTNSPSRQEHGHVNDANVADQRLACLRHEIAVRENELKVQGKSIPQNNEKNASAYTNDQGPQMMLLESKVASSRRPASVAGIRSMPKEQSMKRAKVDSGGTSKPSSTSQLQLAMFSRKSANECSVRLTEKSDCLQNRDTMVSFEGNNGKRKQGSTWNAPVSSELMLKLKDSVPVLPSAVTVHSNLEVSSNPGKDSKVVTDVSHSCGMSEKDLAVGEPLIIDRRTHSLQTESNMENDALRDLSLLGNPITGKVRHLNRSKPTASSCPPPFKASFERSMIRTQQGVAAADAQILETTSHISEGRSGEAPESRSGNEEVPLHNRHLLNYSSQINLSGETTMNLQSLMDLEELQDKELEEAQELRRKCELEERHALKAYRKAQRALLDANEKCSILYRKRELFSAQLRAVLMQDSSSMWPSIWQNDGGTMSESLEIVPEEQFGILCRMAHQLPAEGQNLGHFGGVSNSGSPEDAEPAPQHNASRLQLSGHDFVSQNCWEQDASTSDHRDISALDGLLPPANHPNMSTDDDENCLFDHRSVDSRLAWDTTEGNGAQISQVVNAETICLPPDEDAQNYELLEASLRSKLVQRFGKRISYKINKKRDVECLIQEGAHKNGGTPESPLLNPQVEEGERTERLDLEGIERAGRSTIHLTAQLNRQHCEDGFTLSDEALWNVDPKDNSNGPREFCSPDRTSVSPLPPSTLHAVFQHAKFMQFGCFTELCSTSEKETVLLHKSNTNSMPNKETSALYSITREIELQNYDLAVDPLWPFCTFELRGRCNNNECQWQHIKSCSSRESKHDENSAISFSDGQSSRKSRGAFGFAHRLSHHLPVPTYYIGSNLMKFDPFLSRSLLARNVSQYWQRGFCASFSLPFSVQRILLPDAPFLRTDDGAVADDYSWNRLSLYHQTLDATMKQVHGLPESEQSLEMALDLFDGRVCKPDRKKALCILSRAIEVDHTSVALWVVYLHIYYGKEKNIGKDDMFFHAVQHSGGSYELWLMYINSRRQLDDRLKAYEYALTTLCQNDDTFNREGKDISGCILDIFLQMIDFYCMSGDVEKAILRICGLLENSGDTLLLDILSCLIIYDRCIFWFCCIYLVIYRKLPEEIIQQFELEKDIHFGIEWPPAHLTTDRKEHALCLMKLAVDKIALDLGINSQKKDHDSLRPLHFLAVSHVRCIAAIESLGSCADLLANYMNLYPTCIELVLISARLKESCMEDAIFRGFEDSISNWPKEIPGIQCLWNQYVEYILADNRIDLAKKLLARWFQGFYRAASTHECGSVGKDCSDSSLDITSHVIFDSISCFKQDSTFRFLNLALYKMLGGNLREAHSAIDKALKLASPEDYRHCVKEHAAFAFVNKSDSHMEECAFNLLLALLDGYLGDSRSTTILELLSRKYLQNIKKNRVRQYINDIFGPVSRDFTLMNSVLEVCFGSSLLPEKIDDLKGFVDFVESLMDITPANYKLALSVYKFIISDRCSHSSPASSIKFWATSLLINSVFQAVPVAPEHIWLEAAKLMRDSENVDVSLRFHQQAVSVYPFSIKLWHSYMDLSGNTGNADEIFKAARERGIQLS